MAGHGSPPPEDKGNHPGRQVGRPVPDAKLASYINKRLVGDWTPDEVTERHRERIEDYD